MHEILAAIDLFVFNLLERPRSYATSPESLEDMLYVIEALRDFLCTTALIPSYGPTSTIS